MEQAVAGQLKVVIATKLNVGIKHVSLPVAYIPGDTDEFILLSGHYDSWHKGATDNAGSNALCLELARVFSNYLGKLKRGIKIAWWPGHSNKRYAGSAWYCDHFWQDLNDNCVAHINVDFSGSNGAVKIISKSTTMEDQDLLKKIISDFTGKETNTFDYLPCGVDQSFLGVSIPIHLAIRYESEDKSIIYNPGGGWWWHTEEDLYDKIDLELLLRDTKIHAAIIQNISQADVLPLKLTQFLKNSKKILEEIDKNSDEAFDFTPIYQSLEGFREKWNEVEKRNTVPLEVYNQLLKIIAGDLNRLMFSYSSEYDFDSTFPKKPFPGLQKVEHIYKPSASKESYLFTMTFFVRQRNRFINEMKMMINIINNFMQYKNSLYPVPKSLQ
ncbi:M28 family metallopeptidase [Pseudalkalibacillus decolorationis]|uniref:M28 family metallopeptidase n=1 Tax=Pseudalkalibacillus decolorationis TaxID=163879 RepID=UPI0021478C0F|nr:M28 family peptidase [Pseudalkalibacillus decolorationis]